MVYQIWEVKMAPLGLSAGSWIAVLISIMLITQFVRTERMIFGIMGIWLGVIAIVIQLATMS